MNLSQVRKARDLKLLDDLDRFPRVAFAQTVWRVVREGRDPLVGSPWRGRWSDGSFDVLYTSLERDGALAEIHALLALQPVFPSQVRFFAHRLRVNASASLRLPDPSSLTKLGVDVDRYRERDYSATQPLAEAAHFLGFDGVIAPSARFRGSNAALFTDRFAPENLGLVESEATPIDWPAWRRASRT